MNLLWYAASQRETWDLAVQYAAALRQRLPGYDSYKDNTKTFWWVTTEEEYMADLKQQEVNMNRRQQGAAGSVLQPAENNVVIDASIEKTLIGMMDLDEKHRLYGADE